MSLVDRELFFNILYSLFFTPGSSCLIRTLTRYLRLGVYLNLNSLSLHFIGTIYTFFF